MSDELNILGDDFAGATEEAITPEVIKQKIESVLSLPDEFEEEESSGDSYEPLVIDSAIMPRVFSETYRGWSPEVREEWLSKRWEYKTDPLAMSRLLGFDMQADPHSLLFRQLLSFQKPTVPLSKLSGRRKRLTLAPRGSHKTSCVIVFIVMLILNYLNIRICFLTGSDDLAKRQLARVRRVFENPNPEFLHFFPEFCLQSRQDKRSHKWVDVLDEIGNASAMTVPCRTNVTFAEPTLAISTGRKARTGSHFDVIIADDLMTEQNHDKPALLEGVWNQWIALLPLLEVTGFIFVSGTVWSYDDIYARIQEAAKMAKDASDWVIFVRDCWSTGCTNCKHNSAHHDFTANVLEGTCMEPECKCKGFNSDGIKGVFFPRFETVDGRLLGHTVEFLEHMRDFEVSADFFAQQYENRPISESGRIFPPELTGAVTLHAIDPRFVAALNNGWRFVVGDLAYTSNVKRDISCFYLCRKYLGQIFVEQCVAGHFGENLHLVIMEILWKYRPGMMYLEKPGNDFLNTLLTAEAAKQSMQKLPIQWIDASRAKDAKDTRIRGVAGAMKSQILWLNAEMDHFLDLMKQLEHYPRSGGHDDYADALGQVVEAPTNWQREQVANQPTNQSLRDKYLGRAEEIAGPDTSLDINMGGSDNSWK